ncbi:MAG: S9 family peptidase [Gemmatimonadales bacterium]
MRRTWVGLAAGLTLTAGALQAQGRAFAPEDWYRLATVSSPAISPDGQWVAFTVTTVREKENKRHSEVWLVSSQGGEPSRLTSPSQESSNPRWSPDGRLLLFSSNRPPSRARTWALRMDRPGGEAFEVDSLPSGSYSADGTTVVWTDSAEVAKGEPKTTPWDKMEPMARPPHGAITKPLDPARFDGRHLTEMRYKANGRGFLPGPREARQWHPDQLWIRTAGADKRMITNAAYSHGQAELSPDGRWIAFTADPALRPDSVVQAERDSLAQLPYDAKRDEAPRNDSDVFVISATGGAPRRLTTTNGFERSLAWSPDGSKLAYVGSAARTEPSRIWVQPVSGGAPVNVLGDWRYEPGWFQWTPAGMIVMEAAVGGRDAIFEVDPATRKITELVGGRRRINGVSTDRQHRSLAYVATSVDRPTELYLSDARGQGERQLTDLNQALNDEIAWPDAERFTYKSVGGLEIEAWLQKPFGYEPGKKYPLVLYIHGGPHSAYGEGWFDEFHNITGAGMWVLYTNPRGSSGYGADFTFSTRGRWGLEDYEDLMKAVDIAAKRPDVDSTRMGVTGGSYGGFMTAWVTTRTSRFKAAQADRMISNWWSWYGVSDAQGLTEFEFYGKPWENPKLYDQFSPIRFVDRVTTPTLIVQSEEDHRTPMADAEQWYIGLKKRGIPAELVRYPRSTHDLSRTGEPWLLVDRLGRLRQWFGYWLGDRRSTVAGSGSR